MISHDLLLTSPGKPALITKSGSIYKGDDYMEICMNTMRFAYLTKKGVHSLLGRIPDFQVCSTLRQPPDDGGRGSDSMGDSWPRCLSI